MSQIKHGHTRRSAEGRKQQSPEYRAYAAMKNRCLNKRQARFKDYGARGITVCDRWLHGDGERGGFECFLADLGPKPSSRHSVERVDNDRGYEPGNVKWATRREQARNTRATRHVNVADVTLSLAEAVEVFGAAPANTISMRIHRGWTPEVAILTPVGKEPSPDLPIPF